MENLNISKDTQEQYVDATVAAFMEQYENMLNAEPDQAAAEAVSEEFPKELDDRCRKLIAQERGKRRRKKMLRSCLRVCRSAAVLALVLMCVGTTMFFTVESFRVTVSNKYFEWKDVIVEVSLSNAQGQSNEVGMDVDLNDPLRLALDGEFELVHINNYWHDGMLSAAYSNADATVVFFVNNANGVLQIDTEDAVVTTPLIMDYEVLMVVKGDRRSLIWLDESKERIYELHITGMSEWSAVDICSSVIILFEDI